MASCSAFVPAVGQPPQEGNDNSSASSGYPPRPGESNSVLAVTDERYGANYYYATSRNMTAAEVASSLTLNYDRSPIPFSDGEQSLVGSARSADWPKVSSGEIYVTLTGRGAKPTLLTLVRVKIVSSRKPDGGTLVYVPGEGSDPLQGVGFNLDSTDLNGRLVSEPESAAESPRMLTRHYLDEKQVTLAKDESITFDLAPQTSKCSCEFVFEFGTSDGQILTVSDGGKPWQLSALSDHYEKAYKIDSDRQVQELQDPPVAAGN